ATAIFRQFTPKNFHDFGPWRDRVTSPKPDPCGNQSKRQGVISGHNHLLASLLLAVNELEGFQYIPQRMAVARVKSCQSIVEHARIFSTKPFAQERFQLGHI